MPLPVTGAWLRQTTWARQPQFAEPHTLDPGHRVPGIEDPNPVWQGEPYQEVAPADDMVGLEWVTNVAGLVLDQTPPGHLEGGPHDHDPSQAELYRAHSRDFGADDASTRHEPKFAFSTDRRDATETILGEEYAPGVTDVALRRGLTADPINNPPLASYLGRSYRPGYYRYTWYEHDFSPPDRRHDYRMVRPNLASVVADAPPPAEPGPYNSPFSSLARAIRNVGRKPMLRRVPETISEPVMTDGLDQAPAEQLAVGDWVS